MLIPSTCEYCGADFGAPSKEVARGRGRFCSRSCHYASKRTIPVTTCRQCGKEFRPFSGSAGLFCSMECYNAFRRGLTSEQRAALMSEATARIRGSKRSSDDLRKRAATKQTRATLSDDEIEILSALNEVGLHPVPHYAVDKYNIDFAFPDVMIAVEYNGGNWHNTPKKRAEDEIKAGFLASLGWSLLVFPRIAKRRRVDSGNARILLPDLVREVHAAVTHRSLTPEQ